MTLSPERDKEILEFWRWFKENEHDYRSLKPATKAWGDLDDRLARIGIPHWEVGPGSVTNQGNVLALSADGDRDKLVYNRYVIGLAPKIRGWELLSSRPKKSWEREFYWSEKKYPIDANGWQFLVFRYDDGLFEIVLVRAALPTDDISECERIVQFVILSEIGEELYIERILRVAVELSGHDESVDAFVGIGDLAPLLSVEGHESSGSE